jgi:hypothetical protein
MLYDKSLFAFLIYVMGVTWPHLPNAVWCSSVSLMTRLRAQFLKYRGLIPAKGKRFLCEVSTLSWGKPTILFSRHCRSFPCSLLPWGEAGETSYSPSPSTEFQNGWSQTSTASCAFMQGAWLSTEMPVYAWVSNVVFFFYVLSIHVHVCYMSCLSHIP